MDSTRILILDALEHNPLIASLIQLLNEARTYHFRFHHEIAGSNELPAKSVSCLLSTFLPDLTFVFVDSAAPQQWWDLFESFYGAQPPSPVIAIVDAMDSDPVPEAILQVANDFLIPPFRLQDVQLRIRRLLHRPEEEVAIQTLKEKLGLKQLVGQSPALLGELKKVPAIAACDATALITGETGTGKEVFARAIHYLSNRSSKPFVALNCGAIPVDLMENELFGHESGAYTSAVSSSVGLIEQANEGTLFLDEVDALPLQAQVKLLRFLQDKEYRPLGSSKVSRANVRVLAATNKDLEDAILKEHFRKDLFYRLNVIGIAMPPLRERAGDIALLARHFLARYAAQFNKSARHLTPQALQKLNLYDWPGNVRELENVIERAVVLSERPTVGAEDIHLPQIENGVPSFQNLKARTIAEFEKKYIAETLQAHEGNISKAALAAGKHRRAFWQLMQKHNIRAPNRVSL